MKISILKKLRENLLQGFAIYLGSSILNKAIPFLLLPILTNYLNTQEYGLLALYQVLISFGTPIVGMALHVHIGRNFFKKSKDFLAKIIFNSLLVLIFTSSIMMFAIIIYTGLGGEIFLIPERWLYVLPIILFMNMVNQFNLTILRNQKKASIFGIYEISKTMLDLGLSIMLITVYLLNWEGRVLGIIFSSIVLGLMSFIHIYKSDFIKIRYDEKLIKEIITISLPLLPHALGVAIITISDRIFIDQMVSTSAVGIYTVGYQFGMIMTLVVLAFSRTWSPWMYELLSEEKDENKKTIVNATYLVSGGFVLMALIITGVSYFLLPFMTAEEYHGGFIYVIWIAMGYAFNGMYTLVFPYGVHVGKTSYLGITTFSAAMINLVANYYLIGLNGPLGAAQATLISYAIMFVSVWWYSNRLYPMPWFNFKLR